MALRNLDVFAEEDLCGNVLANEAEFRQTLEDLRDIPIVGDVRGAGYFAIELVKDRETLEGFDHDESEWLLRGFLSGELYRRGLICAPTTAATRHPARSAADLRQRGVQGDRRDPALRPRRGLGKGQGRLAASPGVDPPGTVLTVSSLLDEFDLDLAVDGVPDSAIRWVHISELEDPTPFLSGGELLLTTGINLKTAARQRKFVRLLAGKDAAGLGLAVGLDPPSCRRR